MVGMPVPMSRNCRFTASGGPPARAAGQDAATDLATFEQAALPAEAPADGSAAPSEEA